MVWAVGVGKGDDVVDAVGLEGEMFRGRGVGAGIWVDSDVGVGAGGFGAGGGVSIV